MATWNINVTSPPILTGKTLWVDAVNGNDSSGQRGKQDLPYLTLAAARADSVSGDLIYVRPGDYSVSTSIAKNGVNWHLEAGVVITMTNGTGLGIFDDGGDAMTFAVSGRGNLVVVDDGSGFTQTYGAIATRNVASDIRVECNEISCTCPEDDPGINACVWGFNGDLFVKCLKIYGVYSNCLYWENGGMFVECPWIESQNIATIATLCNDTPTGKMWVTSQQIVNSGTNATEAIFCGGTDATAQAWIYALEIRGDGSITRGVQCSWSGKLYITAQKISGGIDASAILLTDGKAWVFSEKISGGGDVVECSGGTHFFTVQNFESDNPDSIVNVSGGTLTLEGGSVSTDVTAVDVSGGSLSLIGTTIDTSSGASSNPITKSGGALILNGVRLIANSTRSAITASSSQDVSSIGSNSNRPMNANVSIIGDLFYDDGTDPSGSVATGNPDGTWGWGTAPAVPTTAKWDMTIAVSDESTDLTTGTAKVTFRMPRAVTLTGVRASVNTAPVGSTIIVDINEGGSTILSTKLSIDASEKTSTTAATPAVISDASLADDAEITIDIDQVGSTTAGRGLKVTLLGTIAV